MPYELHNFKELYTHAQKLGNAPASRPLATASAGAILPAMLFSAFLYAVQSTATVVTSCNFTSIWSLIATKLTLLEKMEPVDHPPEM